MARPRVAVRGIILHEGRLLLVNAYSGRTDLWCAPGGGVEPGQSLPDNLVREVHEETGLTVEPGPACLINEFHDPASGFHQIDLYFRCRLASDPATVAPTWEDPEGIVQHRRWVSRSEISHLQVKPDSLAQVAWEPEQAMTYDPLEPIVR